MICLIVARAQNGVIGSQNDLPWYLPADLKRFKELTFGHTVVMGRKTFQSILARLGKPLPGRRSVVVTRTVGATYDGADVVHDIDDIERLEGDVYIIGGAEIYRATLHMADKLYITEVRANLDGDAHFPDLDPHVWRELSRESHKKDEKNQYDFDFVVYEAVR